MRRLATVLALLFSLFFSVNTYAQVPLSDGASISLITCGPGNELYSVFGHTAIRVLDPATAMDVVYNYGTFDFATPNFYLKFVKGDLKYFVSASSYDDFVYTYQYYNRDVFEQKLNLTHAQVQAVANDLAATLISDKRFYTYKYFDRNCTTMVGEILEKNLGTKISMQNADLGKTYRQIVYERLGNSFYENLGISLIFGARTDVPMYKLFLPQHLLEGVGNTRLHGAPLSKPVVTVFESTAQPETSLWNNFYTYGAACVLLGLCAGIRLVRQSLFALLGLLGIFFSFVGFYSFHAEICRNYNALLVNPFFLLLLVFSFGTNLTAKKYTGWGLLACIALYIVYMFNKPHLPVVLPLIALCAVLLLRELYPEWKLYKRK